MAWNQTPAPYAPATVDAAIAAASVTDQAYTDTSLAGSSGTAAVVIKGLVSSSPTAWTTGGTWAYWTFGKVVLAYVDATWSSKAVDAGDVWWVELPYGTIDDTNFNALVTVPYWTGLDITGTPVSQLGGAYSSITGGLEFYRSDLDGGGASAVLGAAVATSGTIGIGVCYKIT